MPSATRPDRALAFIKWALYVLGALVLIAGLLGGISLFNAGAAMQGFVPILSAVVPGPFINLISAFVVQTASALGVVILVIALVIALLLFACGKLIARVNNLTQRVARLEEKLVLGQQAE